MSKEEWRPVLGWEGVYEVSSWGRIRRACSGAGGTFKGRLMTPSPNTGGYLFVRLHQIGHKDSRRGRTIHQLVNEAFHGPRPSPMYDTNHKDGNKTNNRASNLEWCTKSENQKHAYRIGLRAPVSGESNGMAKLTLKQVKKLRALAKTFDRYQLAKKFGVHPGTVTSYLLGTAWRHYVEGAVRSKRRQVPQHGENNPGSKLTEKQAQAILDSRGRAAVTELAARYSVSRRLVRMIHKRERWSYLNG